MKIKLLQRIRILDVVCDGSEDDNKKMSFKHVLWIWQLFFVFHAKRIRRIIICDCKYRKYGLRAVYKWYMWLVGNQVKLSHKQLAWFIWIQILLVFASVILAGMGYTFPGKVSYALSWVMFLYLILWNRIKNLILYPFRGKNKFDAFEEQLKKPIKE